MNWKPSKVGAEPKKLAILGGLLAVAAYFYFSSSNPGSTVSATPGTAPPAVGVAAPGESRRAAAKRPEGAPNLGPREFRPTVPKSVDPSSVDPTLHLDELAALRKVEIEGGTRSLFEILAAPPAPVAAMHDVAPIKPKPLFSGPLKPPDPPDPPPPPKAPPIPLKFYGFVNQTKGGTDKRAFFLDGEDIVIATEGDTIKKRYKIIRIGVNSATVEDTTFKSNNQQTLPLEAELNG
ncbi:MAG TPA: hypothetical protein VEV37_13520 [Bryobacteraceae bacterium]|nr:hypothetical protein [Bryobacteraceae bacterium]